MSLIQQMEEADFAASAGHDRFDGFDRGDLDNDDDGATMTRESFKLDSGAVLVLECLEDRYGKLFSLAFPGGRALYAGYSEAEARTILRWWQDGCPF